jgi:nitroimidazol reductase NimA-like FMN-containing flavoprotein (pyridoxamine 5'-phosphate oxidase superfamily)
VTISRPPARSLAQRLADTSRRLDEDVDAWVATAAGDTPYLAPLSFLWDGETFLVATPEAGRTGRNLAATGKVRLGIGLVRDVVLVEGTVEVLASEDIPSDLGDRFAAKTGFDPRAEATRFRYFRIRPRRIQAWREANELEGRDLMRDGTWLAPG